MYFSHPNDQSPTWRITVEEGATIYLRFTNFEVEVNAFGNHDCLSSVVVYDGIDESSAELLRSCGTQPPSPVMSTGNTLFIKFNAMSYDAHEGKYYQIIFLTK